MKESDCYPGMRIGRLTLIKKIRIPNGRYTRGGWLCKCDCGNYLKTRTDALGKATVSCGCYNKEYNQASGANKLHQKYIESDSQHESRYHKLYDTWQHIKARCYRKTDQSYKDYGGRGIKMCSEWKNNYDSFKQWSLLHGFHNASNPHDMTIDRVNVNGNYEPQNCRWVDMKVQANNKRNNRLIPFEGSLHTASEIAAKYDLHPQTVYYRYMRYGWTNYKLVGRPYENVND